MTPETFHQLVHEAAQAPSVHNVQPARWHLDGDAVVLLEDRSRRLAAADPGWQDAGMSLGAALEGFVLAAGALGLRARTEPIEAGDATLIPRARIRLEAGASADPLRGAVSTRRSWRAAFAAPTSADRTAARAIPLTACSIVTEPREIARIAALNDNASLDFQRDPAFRAELLSWMRLSRRHPRWALDGLNAEALQLSTIEALGAGIVLGRPFAALDAIGLAAPLLSESAITRSACAIAVFHMPRETSPLDCGRAFYRDWLRFEAAGFGAAVLAALVDNSESAASLYSLFKLPDGHRPVSAFRLGRRPTHRPIPRARCSLEELIV